MSSFGVVLDACVLVPAALRDTLLRAAQRGLYRPCWSEMILGEVERTLTRTGLATLAGARRLVAILRDRFPRAVATGYERLIPGMVTRDADDRHVVAAAVAAHAQVIVTFNLRDFPEVGLVPYGLEAQHPDGFLTSLYELAPATLREVVAEQAAALRRPPRSYDDILDNLTGQVPEFARLMRG
ncbi:MAG TPA: PIN domain-containing protein [Thermomicrobiales bacterium]|nr:PIN domain-containing protein [Thermomicrobiales bacterium]